MIARIAMTVVAYLMIGAVTAWTVYRCWQDSRDDFKDVLKDTFKKKGAD